jgi:hypothetical protein
MSRQMYTFRATFDALVQSRLTFELSVVDTAKRALASAPIVGPVAALKQALGVLNSTNPDPSAAVLLSQLHSLFDALNASIGSDVVLAQRPSLALDSVATADITDRHYLTASIQVLIVFHKCSQ